MGFRGEALASIASVSRLRLISKPADEAIAYQLSVDGESSIKPKLAPYQQPIADGTIVEVWDLFFRVPAREKFLSSVSSELRKVREVVSGSLRLLTKTEARLRVGELPAIRS